MLISPTTSNRADIVHTSDAFNMDTDGDSDGEVTFEEPGTFFLYCDTGDHEDLGITLVLAVNEG